MHSPDLPDPVPSLYSCWSAPATAATPPSPGSPRLIATTAAKRSIGELLDLDQNQLSFWLSSADRWRPTTAATRNPRVSQAGLGKHRFCTRTVRHIYSREALGVSRAVVRGCELLRVYSHQLGRAGCRPYVHFNFARNNTGTGGLQLRGPPRWCGATWREARPGFYCSSGTQGPVTPSLEAFSTRTLPPRYVT